MICRSLLCFTVRVCRRIMRELVVVRSKDVREGQLSVLSAPESFQLPRDLRIQTCSIGDRQRQELVVITAVHGLVRRESERPEILQQFLVGIEQWFLRTVVLPEGEPPVTPKRSTQVTWPAGVTKPPVKQDVGRGVTPGRSSARAST